MLCDSLDLGSTPQDIVVPLFRNRTQLLSSAFRAVRALLNDRVRSRNSGTQSEFLAVIQN